MKQRKIKTTSETYKPLFHSPLPSGMNIYKIICSFWFYLMFVCPFSTGCHWFENETFDKLTIIFSAIELGEFLNVFYKLRFGAPPLGISFMTFDIYTCCHAFCSEIVIRCIWKRSVGNGALRIPNCCDQLDVLSTEHCLRYLQASTCL